jgi:hypothetical protein
MKFSELLEQYLKEVKEESDSIESPWSIEITKDSKKSDEYNQLGELIIRLSSLRSKMN